MDFVSIASIIVAAIAAFSAIASQRAAAKASVLNTQTTSRVDMEREAYERARNFDTETIRRQDEELDDLRARVRDLEDKNESLRNENHDIRRHVRTQNTRISDLNQEILYIERKLTDLDPHWRKERIKREPEEDLHSDPP